MTSPDAVCPTVFAPAADTLITFSLPPGVEIMRLDDQGMVYKGQRIEDGGEAHRAFMEVMGQMRASQALV